MENRISCAVDEGTAKGGYLAKSLGGPELTNIMSQSHPTAGAILSF